MSSKGCVTLKLSSTYGPPFAVANPSGDAAQRLIPS